MACTYYTAAYLAPLDRLQVEHLEWVLQRGSTQLAREIATLPIPRGGIGLPCYSRAAPALFLAAQSRLLPATAALLRMDSTGCFLGSDPDLSSSIASARRALLDEGAIPLHLPLGPGGTGAPTQARDSAS